MEQTLTQEKQTAAQGNPYADAPARVNPYAPGAAPAAGVMKTKEEHTGRKVFAVILCVMVFISMVMSGFSLALQAVNLFGSGMIDLDLDDWSFDVAREDNVVIADEYKIESTRQISDAYLSGDVSGLSEQDKETLDMAKAVLGKVITDGMTDFEKEVAVYEWLTKELESDTSILTVIPETDDNADTPYGVLKYRNAVCVGYATTFRLFMQMLEINCMVVHDSYRTHSWDLVELDGEWYHTDCYFDSPEGNFRHFNMTDDIRLRDEDWNMDFFPAAVGTKYNYAVMHRETLPDIYAVPAWLKEAVDEGKGVISCSFEKEIEDESVAEYMMSRLSDALNYTDNSPAYIDYLWTQDDNGAYLLSVYINITDAEDYGVSDDEMEKVDSAIEEAFGDLGDIWDDEDGGRIVYNGLEELITDIFAG